MEGSKLIGPTIHLCPLLYFHPPELFDVQTGPFLKGATQRSGFGKPDTAGDLVNAETGRHNIFFCQFRTNFIEDMLVGGIPFQKAPAQGARAHGQVCGNLRQARELAQGGDDCIADGADKLVRPLELCHELLALLLAYGSQLGVAHGCGDFLEGKADAEEVHILVEIYGALEHLPVKVAMAGVWVRQADLGDRKFPIRYEIGAGKKGCEKLFHGKDPCAGAIHGKGRADLPRGAIVFLPVGKHNQGTVQLPELQGYLIGLPQGRAADDGISPYTELSQVRLLAQMKCQGGIFGFIKGVAHDLQIVCLCDERILIFHPGLGQGSASQDPA